MSYRKQEPLAHLAAKMVCDWCRKTPVVTLYAAKKMTDGTPLACWRWAACRECEATIDQQDWKTLAERMARKLAHLDFRSQVLIDVCSKVLQDFINEAIHDETKDAQNQ